jgi:protein-disulfide isomerase
MPRATAISSIALAVATVWLCTAAARAGQAMLTLPADEEKRFADAWAQQPRVDLAVPAGAAKVVIVKFNDWLCGGCKAWHEAYAPLLARYDKEMPGAVKSVAKDWPWSSRCNAGARQTLPGHEASCEAAVAVRLAAAKGKEAEMIAWLFREQPRLLDLGPRGDGAATAIKAQTAALAGITPAEFDRQSVATLVDVRRDVAQGMVLRVESTPTYFVNGVRIPPLPVEYLDLAIRLELKKATK